MRTYVPEKIQNLFGDYIGRPIEINAEGKTFELDLRMQDMAKIMSSSSKDGENIDEDGIIKVGDAIIRVLFRTYLPFWDEAKDAEPTDLTDEQKSQQEPIKDGISRFVVKNFAIIFNQIGKSLGWISPTESKVITDNVKKLISQGSQPQQSSKPHTSK
jgi:hypothetical protein